MGATPRRQGRPRKAEQIELAERRAKAVNLRKSGMQYDVIAGRGVSVASGSDTAAASNAPRGTIRLTA